MAIARLKPGVSVPQAQAGMDRINRSLQQAYLDSNKDWGVGVYTLADVPHLRAVRALVAPLARTIAWQGNQARPP